jgi:hypothetical protein
VSNPQEHKKFGLFVNKAINTYHRTQEDAIKIVEIFLSNDLVLKEIPSEGLVNPYLSEPCTEYFKALCKVYRKSITQKLVHKLDKLSMPTSDEMKCCCKSLIKKCNDTTCLWHDPTGNCYLTLAIKRILDKEVK